MVLLVLDNESVTLDEIPRNCNNAYLYKVTHTKKDFVETVSLEILVVMKLKMPNRVQLNSNGSIF